MIEIEFVVTEEMREFLEENKKMLRMLKDPKSWVDGMALVCCFFMIYFTIILLG